jgi:hypothetical protein
MSNVNLSAFGGVGWQFFDNNGVPLAGGLIYTYAAGTTTPQATYTTSAGTIAHANPIVLNSAGRVPGGEIWLLFASYKFVLQTSASVLIATYDNITSGAGLTTIVNLTGDGTTVSFGLGNATNENTTNVYINGVYQQKNTYALSGSSIVFSEAPPDTSSIEVSFT